MPTPSPNKFPFIENCCIPVIELVLTCTLDNSLDNSLDNLSTSDIVKFISPLISADKVYFFALCIVDSNSLKSPLVSTL